MMSQGERKVNDVVGGDVTRQAGDVTRQASDVTGEKKENDVTVGDGAGLRRCGDVPGAGNYVVGNYIAEVRGTLRPRHGEESDAK